MLLILLCYLHFGDTLKFNMSPNIDFIMLLILFIFFPESSIFPIE